MPLRLSGFAYGFCSRIFACRFGNGSVACAFPSSHEAKAQADQVPCNSISSSKTKQKPAQNEHPTLVTFTLTHVGGGFDMSGVITTQNHHGRLFVWQGSADCCDHDF